MSEMYGESEYLEFTRTHQPECNLGCNKFSHRLLSNREAEFFNQQRRNDMTDEQMIICKECGHRNTKTNDRCSVCSQKLDPTIVSDEIRNRSTDKY